MGVKYFYMAILMDVKMLSLEDNIDKNVVFLYRRDVHINFNLVIIGQCFILI